MKPRDDIYLQGDVYCFSKIEDAVRGAEFVFECVVEDLDIKKSLFKRK